MDMLHPDDRELLKDSVRRAITIGGRGKKNRKKFKKRVAKTMRKTSTLPPVKLAMATTTALELIEELWKEVCDD